MLISTAGRRIWYKERAMSQESRRVTLLELIQAVQDNCGSDAEVVAVINHMISTGRVILRGNFARAPIATA
jgi:hypothetical protein